MKRFFILSISLIAALEVMAWGQKGHDVTAYIAENHLTEKAAEAVDKILDGHSPVYYSNWLDNASHTPEYAYTKTWHYMNVDEGYDFETMPRNPQGDIVTALEGIVKKLKKGKLKPEQEKVELMMLIHLMGDLHCPMHAGHLSDLGGNRWPVVFFSTPTNLHSLWDSKLLEAAHSWSYTEWQQQIDRASEDEIAAIREGDFATWFTETHNICREVYNSTPTGTKISYDQIAEAAPIIEQQLLRAGLRLSAVLNEIYGK